jgi:lipopolysaccharide/colanic/teichoic acid biosynthesis glycosyltransferase
MLKTQLFIKRIFDILVSLLGLIVLSPLFLIVSLLIAILMPGPIFFLQERVGKDKRDFRILKFRSMKVDRAAEATLDFGKDEQRLTALGRILRRTKVDEIPQLLNVLSGDMSLVGPRPTVRQQVDKYNERQMKRLLVKPGLTGLAQVNGNTSLTWDERIEYDVEYVEHFSLWLDLKILLKTAAVVVCGEEKFRKVQA